MSNFRWMMVTVLCCGMGWVLNSCNKDGDTVYMPNPSEPKASTRPLVTVLYDASGIGDQSYDDLVYQGVEEAAKKYSLRTMQITPSSNDEGLAYLEENIKRMADPKDTIRQLLIVTSTVYDEYVRKNSHRLETNPRASLLYFETKKPLEGKGSTLFMPYYGAMYEAGNIASLFEKNTVLVGANPLNETVQDAVMGFNEGFNARQQDVAVNPNKGFMDGVLYMHYIGEKADEGFSINDEEALAQLNNYDVRNLLPLLVPVCGGSEASFVRLADMLGTYTYMGVDCVWNSYWSHFSAVKHIDRAVVQCVGQWLSPQGMPKHQSLGLSSGFTEVVLHPQTDKVRETVKKWLTDDVRQTIREQAIRKEAEYEK